MLQGIDVAKWQGTINWAKVKKNFAILKVTEKGNGIEPAFERNYQGAKANGLLVGAYRYVYAKTVSAAEVEASSIVVALKGKKLDCGIWLDMEDSTIKVLSKSALTKIIEAEAKILKQNGYNVGIYCNRDWYLNVLEGEKLAKTYPFWIARYPSKDTGAFNANSTLSPEKFAAAWQYSQRGKVDGISGYVDLDVAFKSFDQVFNAGTISTAIYYPVYKGYGTSLVSALATVGEKDTSFANRKKIAVANGILNYEGSAAQNIKLVELLKSGKLRKA